MLSAKGGFMYRILDLFCGAGGFSWGLEQNSHFRTLLALDFEKSAIDTFSYNFPKASAICGDITDFSVQNELINLAKKLKINMIIGGPPCQGFSLKGKNLGLKDPRNFLFLEFLKIARALNPKVILIENVKNLYNVNDGFFREEILAHLAKMGYFVSVGVLNALYFGVPQNRERVIFLAHKERQICLPKAQFCAKNVLNVRDAISDLAYLNSGEGEIVSPYETEPKSDFQAKMRENSTILQYHKATNHAPIALHKLSLIPAECGKESLPKNMHGNQKFTTTWGRLAWNEPSPTIDTRFDTPSNGRNSHPTLNRAITPREAARLQSFSDNFIFCGSKTQVCKQIGNAVPPLLSKALGECILQSEKK